MIPKKVVKNVDERIRPQTEVLVKQLQNMSKKLKSEGAKMADQNLIVEYDNGGGQRGIRENPYYQAYEKLLASYTKTLMATKDLIGEQQQAEIRSLDDIRSRFKVAK